MTRGVRIRAGAALAVVLVVVGAIVLAGNGGHTLKATFPSAVNVVPGAEVRTGGLRVGKVESISVHGSAARLTLAIDDDRIWPLRQGTRAGIRLGGTVSYANRYVELTPGPGNARALPDGAELPAQDATSPFEFDELFNTFDTKTRAGLGRLIDRGAATLGPRGAELRAGLRDGGHALGEAGKTFAALSADPRALETLVRAGAATAGELARNDPQLRDLIDGAAETLTTVAETESGVRATIRRLPATLRTARATLARLDSSLGGVDGLVRDIAPGARRLRRVAAPLRSAVGTLGDVAPQLGATLRRVQRSGPTIARFLDDAVPQVQRLRPTLRRLEPMTACLRAYTPEIASFFSTWASLSTNLDASGRYAQLNGQAYPFPNVMPVPSATVVRTFPQLRYALLRPPGLNADQPWLRPSCGADEKILDPANDPEASR
jgi:phospholipid/cholesterol/gamma-HCH transport system substrate-binding protein